MAGPEAKTQIPTKKERNQHADARVQDNARLLGQPPDALQLTVHPIECYH